MPIQDDHFKLFGLPARFDIDQPALDEAYRRVQAQVHPDRFAAATAADRRVAMQWAARANEGYAILRSPLRRAAYLCELNGAPLEAETNTAMPGAFLGHQMQWREQLDDLRGSAEPARLQTLVDDVAAVRAETLKSIAAAIDQTRDFEAAASLVRQLMFIEKFGDELSVFAEPTTAGTG